MPKQWPKSTKRAWQVEIGEGYSSPVVADGRAFLHSRRDPEEIVTAIDLATRQDRVAAEIPGRLHQEPIRDADGQGPELDAARRRRPALHAWRDRHPDRVERRRWHDRVAAGLFGVDRHLEVVLRHGDVADARRRVADRAGRQRRARRPRPGARSGDRQGALGVEGPRARLRVAARGDHRRRAPDHHADQRIDRRHRCRERRIAVVDSVSRTTGTRTSSRRSGPARADRVGTAPGHSRLFDRARGGTGRRSSSGRTPT